MAVVDWCAVVVTTVNRNDFLRKRLLEPSYNVVIVADSYFKMSFELFY